MGVSGRLGLGPWGKCGDWGWFRQPSGAGLFSWYGVGVLLTGEVGQEQANGFTVIALIRGAAGHSCRTVVWGP